MINNTLLYLAIFRGDVQNCSSLKGPFPKILCVVVTLVKNVTRRRPKLFVSVVVTLLKKMFLCSLDFTPEHMSGS